MRKVAVFKGKHDIIEIAEGKCFVEVCHAMRDADLVVDLTGGKNVKKAIKILQKKEA